MRTRLFAIAAALLTLAWSSVNHASDHLDGPDRRARTAGCGASKAPAAQVVVKRADHTPSSAAR